jgi:hypothetical protein
MVHQEAQAKRKSKAVQDVVSEIYDAILIIANQ